MTPQLTFYDIDPRVTAFSTTRFGGYSRGNYGELNLNAYCGDDPMAVCRNRRLLIDALQLGSDTCLLMPHQTHGTKVLCIDEAFLRQPADERRQLMEGVDALTTQLEGLCIGVSTADCIPIIIYDLVRQAAGVVHAGWRGTVARIAETAVRAMQQAYGSQPEQLRAVIGPGISLRHFEVGDEVFDQFAAAGFDMQRIGLFVSSKWHIDLPECNRQQLLGLGVRAENICQTGICTYANADRYFSARRLGLHSGRIFTGVYIKKV